MTEPQTRSTQLAGSWYPNSKPQVEAQIQKWQGYIHSLEAPKGKVIGVIVPHAGWIYSGRLTTAALTMASQTFDSQELKLAVVLGGHVGPGFPLIGYDDNYWDTPMGPMEIATELNEKLYNSELKPEIWTGTTDDNTIEVILPLLKFFAPKARLWALRVPPGPKALALGAILAKMVEEQPGQVLLVASTDLTHYGDAYGFAPAGTGHKGEQFRFQNDLSFIEPTLALDSMAMMLAGVKNKAACSAGAAGAVAEAAKLVGAKPRLLDHYSSYDIIPAEQSVGYAGFCFELADNTKN